MIIIFAIVTVSFLVGTVIGALNQATVTNSISVIKQAEQKAQSVLSEIANHKAS